MYSKEEAQKIKKEFWTQFSDRYPRKWLLYNTKIKDVSFKFYVDNKKAMVMFDIEPKDDEKRSIYYEKMESLKHLLHSDYLADPIFEKNYFLDNGKCISRIWVELNNVSINNRSTWPTVHDFFNEKMSAFELFFFEYEEYIKDLETNT
ncbi:MAG: DUF4268 domain-containing protein [Flavobacterium sp.]